MNNDDQFTTDFLFTTPTYLTGAANAFNLGGNFYEYNSSDTGQEADYKAIRNDFNMISLDLRKSFKIIEEKI